MLVKVIPIINEYSREERIGEVLQEFNGMVLVEFQGLLGKWRECFYKNDIRTYV